MTNIAAASTSPKMSGISSASRSYLQITQTRRPDGISASIRYEPSRRGSRRIIRLYAASTSSADKAWAAIFSRFHSIHLNRRMRAAYQRSQSSIQRDASGCTKLGRHTHKAGTETALALGFLPPNNSDQRLATKREPSQPILSRVRCIALFWLLRDNAYRNRASRLEPDNFSVANSILPLCLYNDVMDPEAQTGSQLLADSPNFCNDWIRLHCRSPAALEACKSQEARNLVYDKRTRSAA